MELTAELVTGAAYALGIGVLIGLERSVPDPEGEQAAASPGAATEAAPPAGPAAAESAATTVEPAAPVAARPVLDGDDMGVRTFAALSVVGFAAASANDRLQFVAPVALAGLIALILVLYRRTVKRKPGMTTEVGAIGTAVLGALCRHEPHTAAVLAVVLAGLLSAKRFTHDTVRRMRRVEVTDTVKFLMIVLIVVPLLPARAVDPLGVINPHKVGWLVVLIAGIGFVGYFLTRILGTEKGLGLTGVLGGLTSSTAVTAAMAAESKASPNLKTICAFATVAANATSFARVLIMVAVLDPTLARRLVWSIGGMAAVAILAAGALWFAASRQQVTGTKEREGQVKLKNPFSLGPALKFGAFFVAILVVSKLAKSWLGDAGIYLAAALSGLADVDAITMSVIEQSRDGSLQRPVGSLAITIAVVSNAVVKTTLAFTTGTRAFGALVALSLGLAVAVGLALALLLPAQG